MSFLTATLSDALGAVMWLFVDPILHAWWIGTGRLRERSNLNEYHQLIRDLTSPRATSGSGRAPSGIQPPPSFGWPQMRSRHVSCLLSISSTATTGRPALRHAVLSCPVEDGTWWPSVVRHWSVDGTDPRGRDT